MLCAVTVWTSVWHIDVSGALGLLCLSGIALIPCSMEFLRILSLEACFRFPKTGSNSSAQIFFVKRAMEAFLKKHFLSMTVIALAGLSVGAFVWYL